MFMVLYAMRRTRGSRQKAWHERRGRVDRLFSGSRLLTFVRSEMDASAKLLKLREIWSEIRYERARRRNDEKLADMLTKLKSPKCPCCLTRVTTTNAFLPPCGHAIHVHCIQGMLQNDLGCCAICRRSFVPLLHQVGHFCLIQRPAR